MRLRPGLAGSEERSDGRRAAGADVYAASSQYVDLTSSAQTPAYYTINASIVYETEMIRTGIAFMNLTDQHYFTPYSYLGGRVAPGEPFSVFGTIAMRF